MDHRFNVCSSVDTEVAWLPLQFLLMVAYLKRLFSRPGNKGRSKTTAAINTLAQLRHIKDLAKKQCIASYQGCSPNRSTAQSRVSRYGGAPGALFCTCRLTHKVVHFVVKSTPICPLDIRRGTHKNGL